MRTAEAVSFVEAKGDLHGSNASYIAVSDPDGKNWVAGSGCAPQGAAASLLATTGYPTDWQRGDANDFVCFVVGPKVSNWQDVLNLIPRAKEQADLEASDWTHQNKQCSVFDQEGRRVVYWQLRPSRQMEGFLTWVEYLELAILCHGDLLRKEEAKEIALKHGKQMFAPNSFVPIHHKELEGDKRDWLLISAPDDLVKTYVEFKGVYPTEWMYGDANKFLCFRVGADIKSLQEVLDKIPEAIKNTKSKSVDNWTHEDVQVSMKNAYGQTVAYGKIPEALTWEQQNELAKLTGGTLMNNQMAQHLIHQEGLLNRELLWFATHKTPDDQANMKDWVNTNDDEKWGLAASYSAAVDADQWEKGYAQPFVCFIVGHKAKSWQDILELIPEAKKTA